MPQYVWDFSVVSQYRQVLIDAAIVTARLFFYTLVLSNLIGFFFALARMSKVAILRGAATLMVEIIRSVPPLVIVVWVYYCLPILAHISFSAEFTCVIGLSIYMSVYFSEIFRAGLQSIDRGHIEAAQSIGLTDWKILRYISGPLAFLRMVPPFTSQCILTIKVTTLASFVAVSEILFEAKRLSIHTFRPLEFLTAIAILFIVTILPLTYLSNFLEKRFRERYFR